MTRGEPYGETILDDRGPHPKTNGDRAFGLGMSVTLDATDEVEAGEWVEFNGDGTVTPLGDDPATIDDVDGLAKHSFDPDAGDSDPKRPDDGVTIHTCGVVRADIDPDVDDVSPLYEVDDDVVVYFK